MWCDHRAAGTFKTIEEAQDKIYPSYRTFLPDKSAQDIYNQLYPLFTELYFTLGERENNGLGEILPTLIAMGESAAQ